MNTRVALVLLVLAAGLGLLVWKLRTNPVSVEGVPAPMAESRTPDVGRSPALGDVPATPARGGEASPGQPLTGPAGLAGPSPSRSPASETSSTVTDSAASEPEPAPLEPVKLVTLDPIQGGGVAAIESRHHSSTFEERAQRLAAIETAFTFGEPTDPEERVAFQALKDELVWLREHPGTPSKAPPK